MANPNHISVQTDGDLIRSDNNNDNPNFRGSKTSLSSNKRLVIETYLSLGIIVTSLFQVPFRRKWNEFYTTHVWIKFYLFTQVPSNFENVSLVIRQKIRMCTKMTVLALLM